MHSKGLTQFIRLFGMQGDEKKHEEVDTNFDVKAKVIINKHYKKYNLPLTKLMVSGRIKESDQNEANKVVQRAVLFLIDRSGSMVRFLSFG